jgi:hypothetical protein
VVSVTDPYGRILKFLDRILRFFFQVAPQLYSRGPVPDSLLLRKYDSAGNRTRVSGSVAKKPDHETTEAVSVNYNETYLDDAIRLTDDSKCMPLGSEDDYVA